MKNYKNQVLILVSISVILLNSFSLRSQNDADTRARWIFNICHGIEWENEENIESYSMGVFSSDAEFNALKKLAESRKLNKKGLEVIKYKGLEDIQDLQIIYVTKNENAHLGFVYEKYKGKNVLIISDRSKEPQYSVININNLNKGKAFELNKELADLQNLKLSTQLIKLGGDREDLQKLFESAFKKIREQDRLLKEKDALIKHQKEEIEALKKEIQALKENNSDR
jgi:hypothetical protein